MIRGALVLLAGMLLTACASLTPRPAPLSTDTLERWEQRRDALAAIEQWDMKGRMAVRTDDDGGSATFVWVREKEVHEIEMFGPFGSGRVTITQDANGASLRDGDNPPVRADTAQELLYRQAGWHVPFESLNYWLKGVPAPEPYDRLVLDADGRALGFRQNGWDVSIVDYVSAEKPVALPRKVFIKALPGTVHLVGDAGEDLGDRLDVKIVLRRWLTTPGPI
ncbi:MAG: outer membrane lipoprotein LolB [Proteobacteria bacterium]|nr:MAG: outer membrane lipoprotein LolB [Pseudomonadota bacterium]